MVARRVVVAPYLAVEFRSLKTELGPEFTAMVKQGNECGITYGGNVKIKEGDTLICYQEEEKKKTL